MKEIWCLLDTPVSRYPWSRRLSTYIYIYIYMYMHLSLYIYIYSGRRQQFRTNNNL